MKSIFLLAAISLLVAVSSEAGDLDTSWQGPLYKACMDNTLPKGTVCFEKDYTGQTVLEGPYGFNNPVSVKVHVRIKKPDWTQETLSYDPEITVVEVNDSNNRYDGLSSLSIQTKVMRHEMGSGGKSAEYSTSATVSINRRYGTRIFENAPAFVAPLASTFSAESDGVIDTLELFFPDQSFSLSVPF